MHDLHPPIGRSGLYWVVDVPRPDLTVAPDGRSATLRLTQVEVIDQPRWPKPDADGLSVPSIGFTWNSDPIETSHANFSIFGEEANGKYYSS